MSSMRNAVQRRVHRERGQLHERRHLGLLEKHKDYSLRAADYAKKKKTLQALHAKAAARNPDEFYFGMLSRRGPGSAITAGGMPSDARPSGRSSNSSRSWTGTVGPRDHDRGDGVRRLGVDAVRLLKTQDVGYVRLARRAAEKALRIVEERARLADINASDVVARRKKIVFCEDSGERDRIMGVGEMKSGKGQKEREDDDDDDDDDDGKDSEFGGFADSDEEMVDADAAADEQAKKERIMAKEREKLRKQLENARHKVKVLAETEQALDEQRAKMAKTATSGGVTKSGRRIIVHKRKR